MQNLVASQVAKFQIFDYILGRHVQDVWAQHVLKDAAVLLFSTILLERYAASY
jgi:hypothetical protein